MKLENKVAVVTGGARRLGRALALALAEEGAHIAVNYSRSAAEAEATAEAARVEEEEFSVYADMETPVLTATDRTFGKGLVGVGSFDDTAYFDDVTLYVPK